MKNQLLAIGILISLIGIFIWLYKTNRKIPVPKGCEDLVAECQGCPIHSCLKHPTQMEEK